MLASQLMPPLHAVPPALSVLFCRQPSSTQGVSDWLRDLPDFRHSMSSHLESVGHMTELAIDECQRYIQSLQKQRQAREEEARQYLDVVMRQGRQILTKIEAEEILEDLDDYSSLDFEDDSSWEEDESELLLQQQWQQDRQQHQQQQQQLEQQPQQGCISLADMPRHATFVLPAESDPAYELQLQQQPPQQQWDVEMSDAPPHRQEDSVDVQPTEEGQMGAGQTAAQAGDSVVRMIAHGAAQPRLELDIQKQQLPEIQQQQQPPDTAAGMGSPAAALPFPGGPTLGAWGLGQWMGMAAAPTQPDSVTVYLGREPYVKTPTLVSEINNKLQ